MRNLFVVLLSISTLWADMGFAQQGATDNYCEYCRDPHEHPDDYVNFAYNQIIGDNGWMDPDLADDFYIYNPDGFVVYVDVDFVMTSGEFLGLKLPLWPTYMLHFTLALPNGTLYVTRRSVFHRNQLPVPTSDASGQDDATNAGDGGDNGGDGENETESGEEWDMPEVENTGTTNIEDPDEDGNFSDTDWCEEC